MTIERFPGAPTLIAKLPSRITKLEFIDGRLFADTAEHGRFVICDDGPIPVPSAPTSKEVH